MKREVAITMNVKDERIRDFFLNGNLFKLIIYISFPILLYNFFELLYSFIDAIMVSKINQASVSAVFFFNEINNAVSALGMGIAVGGSVLVAKEFGAGQINEAKKIANNLMRLAFLVTLIVIFIVIPSAPIIFSLTQTTDDLINAGEMYFIIKTISTAVVVINNVYFGIEKAKGQTKHIFYINIIALIIKFIFTYIFVYIFHLGLTFVGLATLLSQVVIMVIVLFRSYSKNNTLALEFGFSKNNLSRRIIKDIFRISLPLVFSKLFFSLGKIAFNSLSIKYYGSAVIGALGLSSTIANLGYMFTNSIIDAESPIISQNSGKNKNRRALKTGKITLLLVFSISIIAVIILSNFDDFFINLFSFENQSNYELVKLIFSFEVFSIITCGIGQACLGFLSAYKHTKPSLYVNIARVYIFRIPVIVLLNKVFLLDEAAVGMTMLISNISYALVSIIAVVIFLKNNYSVLINQNNLVNH